MRLTHITESEQSWLKGTVIRKQELWIEVEYNREEDSLEVISATLYRDGLSIAEISKLLSDAPGDALSFILESIDWGEEYNNYVQNLKENNGKLF